MTPLPLLRLPDLVFHQIYDVLEVPEIILLSQCSQRLRNMLESCSSPRKAPELRVSVHQHYANVSLTKARQCFKFEKEIINGTFWKITENNSQSSKGWLSSPKSECFEKELLELVRLFRALFKCPIHSIHFEFGGLLKFEKLLVKTDDLHRSNSISVSLTALQKKEMDFMLDHFVSKNLLIFGYPGESYRYLGTLNCEKIEVSGATWIDLEVLEKMTESCKQISLKSASLLTDAYLNRFIKHWMAGDNRVLETVEISRPTFFISGGPFYKSFRLPAIMKEIPHVPGVKKRPDAAEYFESCYKYEKGVDIRRSSDGLMATILLEDSSREFVFTVWYDEEPNLVVEGV